MAALYEQAFDEPIKCNDNEHNFVTHMTHSAVAYRRIALSLGAYQASYEVVPFDSKRDRALANDCHAETEWNVQGRHPRAFPLVEGTNNKTFTAKENSGHDLFYAVLGFGPNGLVSIPST